MHVSNLQLLLMVYLSKRFLGYFKKKLKFKKKNVRKYEFKNLILNKKKLKYKKTI